MQFRVFSERVLGDFSFPTSKNEEKMFQIIQKSIKRLLKKFTQSSQEKDLQNSLFVKAQREAGNCISGGQKKSKSGSQHVADVG